MKPVEQKFTEAASDATAASNNSAALSNPPKLQGSFSANDVPTLKTVSGAAVGTTPNQAAQQHLHNHNASMGRIPAGALPNRHSRELSSDGRDVANVGYQSISSTLHASAAPFGPNMSQNPGHLQAQPPVLTQAQQAPAMGTVANSQGLPSYNNGYYGPNGYNNPVPGGPGGPTGLAGPVNGGYQGVPLLSMQMQGMNLNGANGYSPANYAGYAPVYNSPQPRDSQARVIQSRRQQDSEGRHPPISHVRTLLTSLQL